MGKSEIVVFDTSEHEYNFQKPKLFVILFE